MSLFEWSTPERRRADQILPIIPNEIFIYIFEFTAPPIGRLTPDELEMFANLSRVCRFFANFCLPRIYEFVEFCGYKRRYPMHEDTLCTQIAAKQPLALSLAKRVRGCHFMGCRHYYGCGNWVQVNTWNRIPGVLHMKNIRELKFLESIVDAEHWNAITTLESLEELSFHSCDFLRGPADVKPEERVKVEVSHLRVTYCTGYRQPVAAIHPQRLRTLVTDYLFLDQVDWLSQSSLIELQLRFPWSPQHNCAERVHTLLTQLPRSLETLRFCVDVSTTQARDKVRSLFADPAWKNLSLLRSLKLQILCEDRNRPGDMLSFVFGCISLLADLLSFTVCDYLLKSPAISLAEVRRILHDKLGPSSSIKYADICGKSFCLVDGEWSPADASRSTT